MPIERIKRIVPSGNPQIGMRQTAYAANAARKSPKKYASAVNI